MKKYTPVAIAMALFVASFALAAGGPIAQWPDCAVQVNPCYNRSTVISCYGCCYEHCNPQEIDPNPPAVQQCTDCCKPDGHC